MKMRCAVSGDNPASPVGQVPCDPDTDVETTGVSTCETELPKLHKIKI